MDKPFIKGITFSGGDPLAPENLTDVLDICYRIKRKFGDTKDIWMYTGYTYENLSDTQRGCVNDYADVLVDGRFIADLKDITLLFRGSSNQRLIDIKRTVKEGEVYGWNIQ